MALKEPSNYLFPNDPEQNRDERQKLITLVDSLRTRVRRLFEDPSDIALQKHEKITGIESQLADLYKDINGALRIIDPKKEETNLHNIELQITELERHASKDESNQILIEENPALANLLLIQEQLSKLEVPDRLSTTPNFLADKANLQERIQRDIAYATSDTSKKEPRLPSNPMVNISDLITFKNKYNL